jgi:ATP-binding cassette subfamily B protein
MPHAATSRRLRELVYSLGFGGPYSRQLTATCLCSVFGAIFGLAPHAALAWLISIYVVSQNRIEPHMALLIGGVLAVALVLRFLLRSVAGRLAHMAAFNTLYDIRMTMAQKLSQLPLGYMERTGAGKIKKMLVDDVEQFEIFIAHHLVEFSAATVMPVIALIILFFADWRMATAAFIVVPLSFIIQAQTSRGHAELTRQYHDKQEDLNNRTIEYVQGMPDIKAFVGVAEKMRNLSTAVQDYQTFLESWMQRWYVPRAAFTVLLDTPLLFTLPLGLVLYNAGDIGLGRLVFCLLISGEFTAPIFKVLPQIENLLRILEGYRRMAAMKDEPLLPRNPSPLTPKETDIVFRAVSFAYDEGITVLDNINLTIPAGKMTAVVGLSGSGKSTLLRLISRFWDVTEGSISIGNIDVRDIDQDILMQLTAFMFQENTLFNESVAGNIALGKSDASPDEIRNAAHTACCEEFIERLPDGYESQVGELGTRLSGGERQRIALARTLLKPAPILLLDEATAFADAVTEARVHKSLAEARRGCTVVMVAHRLQSIVGADQIIVLDKGRVTAVGTHTELLESCPLYNHIRQLSLSVDNWKIRGE